jgi:glycerol-3-phosphate acyltransferase PlsY
MHPAIGLLIGYIAGSIPFAYLAGKLVKGIDLRHYGSGNLGATNVYRTLGARVAAVVFLLDTLKGALPVLAVRQLALGSHLDLWAIAAGVAAIAGHAKPVFLLWKGGGKGVATAGGVFLALAPLPALASMATFIIVVLLTGYVSVASLTAACVLPVVLGLTIGVHTPLFVVSLLIAAFVFWTHRANIGRLRRGEEHRFGKKAQA